jgi:DNA-binding HxlR family transcriptional regulator
VREPNEKEVDAVANPLSALPPVMVDGCDADTRGLVREMIVRMADKWSLLLIEHLSHGPERFTGLMAAVPGISHRMLTHTLRTLERDGMVTRTVHAEVPPRVDYALTDLGMSLSAPVAAFVVWAHEHHSEVAVHRATFDARGGRSER